jgi:hypothetical protein
MQVLAFIKDHPATILMIEKGYKYYFHEESAKVSSPSDIGLCVVPNTRTVDCQQRAGDYSLHKAEPSNCLYSHP